ncbi:hypothetical protein DMENIID0001_018020 [Sergentomyia squamirostris]
MSLSGQMGAASGSGVDQRNYSIEIKNQFGCIDSEMSLDGEQQDDSSNQRDKTDSRNSNNTSNKIAPAPITVTNVEFSRLSRLLQLSGYKHTLKMMKIGHKIQLESKEEATKFCEILAKENIQYFTYQLSEDRLLKFVLSGLYSMPIEELRSHLLQVNVSPFDIKSMKIQNKTYDEQANYIVYFKKGTTTLSDLKHITSVNNVIIQWKTFTRKNDPDPLNALQCSRCQMFGHMHRFCGRSQICAHCGQHHALESCPNAQQQAKCVNCGLNHNSTSLDCTKRAEYIELRRNAFRTRVNQNQRTSVRIQRPEAPNINSMRDFPSMPATPSQNRLTAYQQLLRVQQTATSSQQAYIEPIQPSESSLQGSVNNPRSSDLSTMRNSDQINNSTQSSPQNENLFSISEIMTLTQEVVKELGKCRTKQEQFSVIVNLSVKYLYNINDD